jgi:hypothetical protein
MKNNQIARNVAAKYLKNAMTANDIITKLRSELAPIFKDYVFGAVHQNAFRYAGSIRIMFANVPPTATELERLNSTKNLSIYIADSPGRSYGHGSWGPDPNSDVPEKLYAYQSTGNGIKFRGYSGTPEKVVDYVIKWFKLNQNNLAGTTLKE